jgi:prepilin peptidase CpaA
MILDLARLFLFPALIAFAAANDLFTMIIPNRLSLLLIAGFFVLAGFGGMSLQDIAMHASAGLIVLVAAFALFSYGWIGGGDAKIAASVALWFGFPHLIEYLLYTSIFGGALTLLLLQFRQYPLPAVLASQPWISHLHDKKTGVPYGIALAIGALMIYPETEWMSMVDLTRFMGQ